MKTIKLLFIFTLFAFFVSATTITIVHVNDTHSHLDANGPKDHHLNGKEGGIAKAATIINGLRATEPNVLLLHAGDLFQGDPMFNKFFGVPELQIMKQLGFDAMTIGNHEFDLGPAVLHDALMAGFANGSFSMLSANLDMSAFPSLQNFVQPSVIKNIGGVRIGIFGMTVPDNPTNIPFPVVISNNITSIAQQTVNDLRNNGAQVVICLSHLGINNDSDMIAGTSGIDIVIGGHDHLVFDTPREIQNLNGANIPIFQAGAHYKNIGEVHFNFVNNTVSILDSRIIHVDHTVAPDPAVKSIVDQLKLDVINQFGNVYNNVLSKTNSDIPKTADRNQRWKDTPLGNLITDAFRNQYHTKIAITPLGLISEKLYDGKITEADVFRAVSYGFDPATAKGFQMATFDITGLELIKAMEFGLSQIGLSDDFFLQYSGMKFKYDQQLPVGQRVLLSSVYIGNKKLSLTKIYSVAVNSGVAGLIPLAGVNATNMVIRPEFEYDVVCKYISRSKNISYHSEGRIKDLNYSPIRISAEEVLTNGNKSTAFPNPFNEQLYFNIDVEKSKNISITLYNQLGEEVYTREMNVQEGKSTIQINAESFNPGLYFFRISNGNNIMTGKVVCTH